MMLVHLALLHTEAESFFFCLSSHSAVNYTHNNFLTCEWWMNASFFANDSVQS